MLTHELGYWQTTPAGLLAGVDEAGRGPLAGPVVAAAISVGRGELVTLARAELAGLTDSKALTARKRQHYHDFILSSGAIRVGVGLASVSEIDKHNILGATRLAMCRAINDISAPPVDHVLLDGLPMRQLPCGSTPLVGGDGRSLLIAAASVIAKVTRDHIMAELALQHPHYGWERNKGYGTRQHLAALREHGVTPHHRRSFRPVAEILQPSLLPGRS